MDRTCVVTGAFGYSGRYIARRLLDAGWRVRTMTNSARRRNPFGDALEVHPYHFDNPEAMTEALRGAEVLINTYWVRFNHRDFTFEGAVRNSMALFDAARRAGVRRIVHVSITNPSEDSPLGYFRGKARLERALRESGVAHTILRPAVLFGREDILINNIAWGLRRFPVFGVFGDGMYEMQPIYVDDFAALAVAECEEQGDRLVDAIGPETFAYRDLVEAIGVIIDKRRPIVRLHPAVAHACTSVFGLFVGDVIVTREEIEGLMANLLRTNSPPAGTTRLTDWAREHAGELGHRYSSELARRRNREQEYGKL